MKLRMLSLIVMTLFAAAGCGDSTGPDDSVEGTYTLISFDGKAPPAKVEDDGTTALWIDSGRLTLNEDRTFSMRFVARLVEDGSSFTIDDTLPGTYTYADGVVNFTYEDGETTTATHEGDRITFSEDGSVAVFRK